tara:strand:+ start:410 stop:934 length:525 start_codon:yes stop_codon:yes gene_type:complete
VKWKDILKEVITQGKIKEIEDINIDIDDDDCLRWLRKLYSIITRYPEGKMVKNEIITERDACDIKKAWEMELGILSNKYNVYDRVRTYAAFIGGDQFHAETRGDIILDLYREIPNDKSPETYGIHLGSGVDTGTSRKEIYATFVTNDKEKVIKVIKEICNYLNLDYNRLLERIT